MRRKVEEAINDAKQAFQSARSKRHYAVVKLHKPTKGGKVTTLFESMELKRAEATSLEIVWTTKPARKEGGKQ